MANSTNGINVGPTTPTGYITFRQVTIEVTSGTALQAVIASRMDCYEIHIEDKTQDHGRLVYLNNCQHVNFFGFSGEISATLTSAAYYEIEDCRSVNFFGGRLNHSGTASKTFFLIKGNASQNVNFEGMDFISTKAGMRLFHVNAGATLVGISLRRIRTTLTSVGTGIEHETSVISGTIEDWVDNNASCGHTLKGTDLYVRNVTGALSIAAGARHTLINYTGVIAVTGTDSSTRINSDSGSALRITLLTFADNAAALGGGAGPAASLQGRHGRGPHRGLGGGGGGAHALLGLDA